MYRNAIVLRAPALQGESSIVAGFSNLIEARCNRCDILISFSWERFDVSKSTGGKLL